jgi:hypothetical protein
MARLCEAPRRRSAKFLYQLPACQFQPPGLRNTVDCIERASELTVDGTSGVRVVAKIDGQQTAVAEVVALMRVSSRKTQQGSSVSR